MTQTKKEGFALLIDPRSAREYQAEHLPGAINLALTAVEERQGGVDPKVSQYKNLIVYGDDPGSPVARAMTKRLMATGHKAVRWYSGGLREWVSAGNPTIKKPGAAAASDATGGP